MKRFLVYGLFTFEYPRVNAIADSSCIDEPVRALYNCIVRKYVVSLSKVAVQLDAKESKTHQNNSVKHIQVTLTDVDTQNQHIRLGKNLFLDF